MRDDEKFFKENNITKLKKKSYYELLNVGSALNQHEFEAQVKRSYHQLSLRFHPDKTQGDTAKAEIFKIINEAQETLLDPVKKRQYDAKLKLDNIASPGNTVNFFRPKSQPLSEARRQLCEEEELLRGFRQESEKTCRISIQELEKRRRQILKEETIVGRIVKAYVIKGGTKSERLARLDELKAIHLGLSGVGLKCLGHLTTDEYHQTLFSEERNSYFIRCTDEGDYSESSYSAIIFSNGSIFTFWKENEKENFIHEVAKKQGNIEMLKIHKEEIPKEEVRSGWGCVIQ